MIRVSFAHVTIAADTEEKFQFALSQFEAVKALALASPIATKLSPSAPRINIPAPAVDYCTQWLESTLNVGSKERFRMTRDELANFGEGPSGRQEAAKARLSEGGLLADAGDAVEGAKAEGADVDETLLDEF